MKTTKEGTPAALIRAAEQRLANAQASARKANARATALLAECRKELRAIDEEQLGDYELEISKGKASWGHVGDLGRVLQLLRQIQGKEEA